MREHHVGLMTEQARDTDVALIAVAERCQRLDRFLRDALPAFLRHGVPAAAIEREHAVENPPALNGFVDVGMTHGAPNSWPALLRA